MECLIATVVLSIAVGAIAQSISSGQKQTADSLHVQHAQMLAAALMDEVLSMPLSPDGKTTTRAGFYTQLSSFHNFTEAAGQVKNALNTLYPAAYQKFSRSVVITSTNLKLTGCDSLAGWNITVTITDSNNRTWTLTRFVPAA